MTALTRPAPVSSAPDGPERDGRRGGGGGERSLATMRSNDAVLLRAPSQSGAPLAGRRGGGGSERSLAIMRAKDAVVAVVIVRWVDSWH